MARNRKKSLPKVSYPRGRRRVPEKTTARTYPYRVRRTSRGLVPATSWMLDEADLTRLVIREEADLCDQLVDNLPPGHEMWGELLRLSTALGALSESMAVSAEAMGPRIEQGREIAGLKYLVGELRKNAGLAAVPT